jgi:hypothetical protein
MGIWRIRALVRATGVAALGLTGVALFGPAPLISATKPAPTKGMWITSPVKLPYGNRMWIPRSSPFVEQLVVRLKEYAIFGDWAGSNSTAFNWARVTPFVSSGIWDALTSSVAQDNKDGQVQVDPQSDGVASEWAALFQAPTRTTPSYVRIQFCEEDAGTRWVYKTTGKPVAGEAGAVGDFNNLFTLAQDKPGEAWIVVGISSEEVKSCPPIAG